MLYPLFLLGGTWFYALVVIETIILIWCLEKDEPWFANSTLVVFFAAMWLLGDFNVFTWIKNNPGTLFKSGFAYVIIGLIYAVTKYTLYLTDKKRKYDRKLNAFLDKHGVDDVEKLTTISKQECARILEYVYLPTFMNSTKSIIFWMMYWPWSAIWTLLNNPLKWLYEEIYDAISGLFKRIHERIIGTRLEQIRELKNAGEK